MAAFARGGGGGESDGGGHGGGSARPQLKHAAIRPVYDPPQELVRLAVLTKRFATLYWRVPDFYVYRLVCITLFGLLAGTLYLDTPPSTSALTRVTIMPSGLQGRASPHRQTPRKASRPTWKMRQPPWSSTSGKPSVSP